MRFSAALSKKACPASLILCALFIFAGTANANLTQIKAYKEAYPDEKPKCAVCHVSDKPKKEDGQHDMNDYGKKVIALNAAPDASTYKAAGKNESK